MRESQKIIIALKKAQSHLSNVIAMVENKKYCIDILQQNLAVVGLLKSANNKILERHLNSCFASAMAGGSSRKKRKMIDEVIRINKNIN